MNSNLDRIELFAALFREIYQFYLQYETEVSKQWKKALEAAKKDLEEQGLESNFLLIGSLAMGMANVTAKDISDADAFYAGHAREFYHMASEFDGRSYYTGQAYVERLLNKNLTNPPRSFELHYGFDLPMLDEYMSYLESGKSIKTPVNCDKELARFFLYYKRSVPMNTELQPTIDRIAELSKHHQPLRDALDTITLADFHLLNFWIDSLSKYKIRLGRQDIRVPPAQIELETRFIGIVFDDGIAKNS